MRENREREKQPPGIVIFAGTTEGRALSECLAKAGIRHTVCVATEYGELALKENPYATVRRGRMNREEIREFLQNGRFGAVADATHPFAKDVTGNIKAAVEELRRIGASVSYLRLIREDASECGDGDVLYFETHEACAMALEQTRGNILLTAGSKDLSKYCVSKEVKDRLYVRTLPSVEGISLCMEQGICGKQVIAMQGPFTAELNEALIRQYHISHLVTKESGVSGGYREKLEAAKRTGTKVYALRRETEREGYSFFGVCRELEKICGCPLGSEESCEVTLAGVGMGEGGLTEEVRQAISEADILFGSKRLLEHYSAPETVPFYQAEKILPFLKKARRGIKAVTLFSGDSGFYSGCQPLCAALEKEIREGRLQASLRVLPGISSVSYLAACIGESYQDASVYSMHGKSLYNLAKRIKNSPKTFLLTSGVKDVNRLGELLYQAGLSDCEVVTGYQLSCKEQRIQTHTPSECRALKEEGLYTCFVKNPRAGRRNLTHGMPDELFIRGKVPMTKEEAREAGICKLRLKEDSVVYDIGSGTGSVAVEIAGLSDNISVYAVEQKQEALSLIRQNKEKFLLENLVAVEAQAPEGLADLPAATHAFIGGSGGRLKEIIKELWRINPNMRIVMHAVSIETLCEVKEILSMYRVKQEEIVQLSAVRAKKAGKYHLMQSENPVWICSFDFAGGDT